jgi:SAM-dependent methyltransferase
MESEDYNPAFTVIAPYYDKLMSFINYQDWVAYIEKIIALNNIREKKILDLACGTGVCLELWLQRQYQVIGLDQSFAMLQVCKDKLSKFFLADDYNWFLINGDMYNFALAYKIPIITCLYDSLNYLMREVELVRCFEKVYETLCDDGIFIFDMNTIHSLRDEWGNQIYYRQDSNIHSTWVNTFHPEKNISSLKLTLTIRRDGRTMTQREFHQERAYPLSTIKNLLSEVGFKASLYRHLTFQPAQESDLRIMGVVRK